MIKDFLVNVLLKRGVSAIEETLGKLLRHGLTTYGGMLVAQGYATQDDMTTLAGAGTVIVGIILSVIRTMLAKYLV